MTPTELVYRLLGAAGRVCDLYDDGEQARVDMRTDVLGTPPHLRADLLDHFNSIAPAVADLDQSFADSPSFGASTGFDAFLGPPGDPSDTGNSDPALSPFRNLPRGVVL